jgi:DNA-binding transcriptional ArsR family regulator
LTIAAVAGIVKSMLNQVQEVDLDRVFRALADPARRSIVAQLAEGPASVSQLSGPLSMSLAGVLQHVQLLEASGLVRTEKIGRTRSCRIEPQALRSAEAWISERRSLWERRLDRLGSYLEATEVRPQVHQLSGPADPHPPRSTTTATPTATPTPTSTATSTPTATAPEEHT